MNSQFQISKQHWVRKIERLEKKIQALHLLNKRFSLIRMVIFGMGAVATWIIGSLQGSKAGWLAFSIATIIFLVVVLLHRNLDNWIRRFEHWQQLYLLQLACSQLDWESIPYRSLPEQRVRSSLETDLDLTGVRSLHHLLDHSISDHGSRLLADWLTHPQPDIEQIVRRQNWVKELAAFPYFGMRFHLVFSLASKERIRGDQIVSWLNVPFESNKLRWSLPVAGFLTLLNLGLFIANAVSDFPAFWILTAVLYLVYYNFTGRENAEILDQVAILDVELGKLGPVLKYLEKANYQKMPALHDLCRSFTQPGGAPSAELRRLKWVTAAVGLRMNPIMGFLLNIFLPWDYFWANMAIRFRQRLKVRLPVWLDKLYKLEALLSLAEFSRSQPVSSFPIISPVSPTFLEVEQIAHPLLLADTRVANDFCLAQVGEAALITGSNMAGKSTFIKTIGINLCLAYAGSAVMAKYWRSLPLRLHSCIRISDSISDGFSYFYAEVKCLSGLLRKLEQNASEGEDYYPVLYLIDEIFRGTNNRERLIGSRAYLQAAIRGNGAGLVATHDLELSSLALQSTQVKNYHFRDRVEDGRLVFDYLIRVGASPTTNALKIMALEGLPVDL